MSSHRVVKSVRAFILPACIVALFPCGAAAQQISGGVKLGLSIADIPNANQSIEPGVSTGTRLGFAAGVFVLVKWENRFGIEPEVLYVQKGVKVTASGVTGQANIRMDFLDVPILARYTIGKVVRGYVFGGPSFDFKLNAKATVVALGASQEQDLSSDVKSFEFAVVFGGGVELGPLLAEARWSEGLNNLDATPTSTSPALKTRTFLVLGGLRF